MLDCLIIGGGPAGLTAAIYLARFHLAVTVVDAGQSRALWIPETHNHAGFPEGISGADLLARMRQQAIQYGTHILERAVSHIARDGDHFVLNDAEDKIVARTVLLATGVVNRRPDIDEGLHEQALGAGRLRYCPICDGYEVTDQKVGVIGTGERGMKEAILLRSYTKDITLISADQPHCLDFATAEKAKSAGIKLANGPAKIKRMNETSLFVNCADGELEFASVYPALGSDINNILAKNLGARCNDTGCIWVDAHQRTSLPGLYAAGDVVIGLDQISHAMGEGGVAAVTLRNDLAQNQPLFR